MRATVFLTAISVALTAILVLAPTPVTAGSNCSVDATIDNQEAELLRLINNYRQENGLDPLALSDTLNSASAWKSAHMADNDYFSHDDAGLGRSFDGRIRDCGYTANTWIGENIAAGNRLAADTFEQWRTSSGHSANMLNSDFVAIGIGRAYNADSQFDWYWTAAFGGFADGYAPPASFPDGAGDVDCTGETNSIDAALLLQLTAGFVDSLPCADVADVNGDGAITATDATLILQLDAGMIS
ncbi:MAG: hypothetical protein IH957_13505 [Chloroflexi bacterium]|nr:hypothetical protein [Chloroflexota bacterium]